MDKQAAIRRVRIAVSMFFAVLTVAMCVLWMPSYWWRDAIHGPLLRTHAFNLSTSWGRVRFATFDRNYENQFTGEKMTGWGITSRQIEQPPSLMLVNTPLSNFGLGFAGSRDHYGIVVIIPIYTLAAIVAALTGTPWVATSHRFSLRTLLIATTLIASTLGLVVWLAR